MIMTVVERYRRIAPSFEARVDGIAPHQWGAPTPCSEWGVWDLVAHVIDVHHRMVAKLHGAEPVAVDIGEDLPRQWHNASNAAREGLADPGRASTLVYGPVGQQPFESLIEGLVCADVVVHTWDLARATGQDERLDPAVVSNAVAFLQSLDDAMHGGDETFAAKIEPTPGSDAQTKLLNFCGRAV